MGQAKRRQQNDPTYGMPAEFTLQLFHGEHDWRLLDIPFTVRRRPRVAETEGAAVALALQIVGFWVDPADENREFALWVAFERSEASASQKGHFDRLHPDFEREGAESDTLNAIKSLLSELPPLWYCRIARADGTLLHSRQRDGTIDPDPITLGNKAEALPFPKSKLGSLESVTALGIAVGM